MAEEPIGLSLEEPEIVGITEKTDPPPAVVDEEPTPEGTIEGSGGVKFVPLQAVIAERTQRKEATGKLAAKDAEIAALKTKADRLDAIANEWQQLEPVLTKVRNGEFVPRAAAPPPEAPKPLTDAEAVEYAKDLDLFKTDGTPDVDRAQRLAARQEALASRSAAAAVAPFQANDAKRTSDAMFNHIASFKDANGHMVDKGELTKIWDVMPPEMSSKPEVAAIIYDLALAASIRAGKYKGTQAPGPAPVVTTESMGGGGRVRTELDQVGAKFARASDIKTADFLKTSEKYKPGAVNSLE